MGENKLKVTIFIFQEVGAKPCPFPRSRTPTCTSWTSCSGCRASGQGGGTSTPWTARRGRRGQGPGGGGGRARRDRGVCHRGGDSLQCGHLALRPPQAVIMYYHGQLSINIYNTVYFCKLSAFLKKNIEKQSSLRIITSDKLKTT